MRKFLVALLLLAACSSNDVLMLRNVEQKDNIRTLHETDRVYTIEHDYDHNPMLTLITDVDGYKKKLKCAFRVRELDRVVIRNDGNSGDFGIGEEVTLRFDAVSIGGKLSPMRNMCSPM